MEDLGQNNPLATSIANSNVFSYLMMSLLLEKYTPVTKTLFQDEYDYIVVGAGAAGSVVASRLSELLCADVLLLEAGSSPSRLTEVPVLSRAFFGTSVDWKYKTVPQKYTGASLNNRELPFSIGKAIGGSTVWNDMLYIRGNRQDFDDWAEGGAEGWSYEEVLPYFQKMEDMREKNFSDPRYHGFSGPLTAERPGYNPIYKRTVFKAAEELGYPTVDSNGPQQYGFFDFVATLRDGRRCSTAKAYLVPADDRSNLDIVPNAFVKKVVIRDQSAVGVLVSHGGKSRLVRARKEIILSAGAIHTPQILMLSGIGPKSHLEDLQIPVVSNLPVGLNFHDHVGIIYPQLLSSLVAGFLPKVANPLNVLRYIANGKGPLSSTTLVSSLAFLTKDKAAPRNSTVDYQLYFIESVPVGASFQLNAKLLDYNAYYGPYLLNTVVWCLGQITNPKSRGSITLNKNDPYGPPVIDPNYFSDERDVDDCVSAVKTCREVFSSQAFLKIGSEPFRTALPGCEKYLNDFEELIRCHIRSLPISIGHPVGTAKMGAVSDSTTVVDSELKVKGINNLRVVDASVMPIITSGNTEVPTVMIAEKISDVIKKGIKCSPNS